ncbi:ABC transporter ATP-binding protein [Candidatus Contubernalis alkaliaceticus]|uniref:ABC transporter ATP-binding protein n=1 Tax=Candidatus Contubernalis alkaliaceticus TaxID=338645 RepID=UPI001F4C2CF8|nr:ABC transporter ATP-binding protein [Candidatus Contubernalis alkalaceticus]UNC92082.1 ABC transporter ATP-binding protein [Candidatus Contubernalis alkalaceticus]
MQNVILSTKDLCKTYVSDGIQFHAIRNINLEIYRQDFTVIMGSSGSGKSTLLYLLSGIDSVTAGEVSFQGSRVDLMDEKKTAEFRRKSIGFIFQAINLVPNLTLFENIAISGYLVSSNRKQVNEKTKELLAVMGLEQEAQRLPSQVSGGQQQRAAIARGLINSPTVLFADEPTGSLNSQQSQNVLDILTDINTEGQTIVMVTHDIKAACRADRILFIKDGKIGGDLKLEKYSKNDSEQREKEIFRYLTEKGW